MYIKRSILPLTLGGFGIGMTEFVTMGILPDIAHSLDITVPQVGHLISAYALGVVVGAPLLVAVAGHWPPRRILIVLMGVFTLFNALSAVMPGYGSLMLMRFLSGLPHGAFFGVGAVVAGRLAAPGKSASAVATMFAGLTIANLAGVPLGTYFGHMLSWRVTYGSIALVGLVTMVALKRAMPELPASGDADLRRELGIFRRARVWLILAVTAIGTGGLFAWYSYIAPLTLHVAGIPQRYMTGVLVIAGFGMFVGNILGGKLADRLPAPKAAGLLLAFMVITLAVVGLTAPWPPAMLVMTFVAGGAAFSLAAPIQVLVMTSADGSPMLASSLGQAGFNIGNALGAFVGGLAIKHGLGYAAPSYAGAGLAAIGVALTLVLMRFVPQSGKAAARPLVPVH